MRSTNGDVNAAFAAYQNATDSTRPELEYNLIRSLQKYARSIVSIKMREDHPEIVNDAVVYILSHLSDFRGEAKFTTWAYPIVERLCFAELRRKIIDRNMLVKEVTDEQVDESATYELNGDAKFVLDRLRQPLSEEENLLIDLKLQGHTNSETAQILSTTTVAVESRWRRLCNKLQKTEKKRKATGRTMQAN